MSRAWRVIGIGTAHGDDELGLITIKRLRSESEDRGTWEFHAVDSAQRLLDLLEADASVILVDAIAQEAEPGTVHRITWPNTLLKSLRPGSTHVMGVAQALELAEVLGILPTELVIFGIESGDFHEGGGLSQKVSDSVPALLGQIRLEMRTLQEM
ncbi:MAG: hydrogenase maturation protease [Planctomycetes bacterium]|nr:hydrogenase maturation protease [Planctomycetota bacterium]